MTPPQAITSGLLRPTFRYVPRTASKCRCRSMLRLASSLLRYKEHNKSAHQPQQLFPGTPNSGYIERLSSSRLGHHTKDLYAFFPAVAAAERVSAATRTITARRMNILSPIDFIPSTCGIVRPEHLCSGRLSRIPTSANASPSWCGTITNSIIPNFHEVFSWHTS